MPKKVITKSKKKLKRHEVRIKTADQFPKIMVVIGDTLIVRDFIKNDLKPRFNLSIQNVPATIKRTGQTFKSQIFDGSQCNASFKENGFLGNLALSTSAAKENASDTTKADALSKLLLFEDIDLVFNDEADFYSQLGKLIQVTKVPVILTASNSTYICTHLLPLLRKTSVEFEMLKYAFNRPPQTDLFTVSMLIKLFEGPISSQILKKNDMLVKMSQEQISMVVRTLCSPQILKETSLAVQNILHYCLKDGLPSILNNLQLSKNRQIGSSSPLIQATENHYHQS